MCCMSRYQEKKPQQVVLPAEVDWEIIQHVYIGKLGTCTHWEIGKLYNMYTFQNNGNIK